MLCTFLDLPISSSYKHHVKQTETLLGMVQIPKKLEIEAEERVEEIEETKRIEGNQHSGGSLLWPATKVHRDIR